MTIIVIKRVTTKSLLRLEWATDLSVMDDEEYNKECKRIVRFVAAIYPGWTVHSPRPLRIDK